MQPVCSDLISLPLLKIALIIISFMFSDPLFSDLAMLPFLPLSPPQPFLYLFLSVSLFLMWGAMWHFSTDVHSAIPAALGHYPHGLISLYLLQGWSQHHHGRCLNFMWIWGREIMQFIAHKRSGLLLWSWKIRNHTNSLPAFFSISAPWARRSIFLGHFGTPGT